MLLCMLLPSLLLLLLLLPLPALRLQPRQIVWGVVPPGVEQKLLARQLHAQVEAAGAVWVFVVWGIGMHAG